MDDVLSRWVMYCPGGGDVLSRWVMCCPGRVCTSEAVSLNAFRA